MVDAVLKIIDKVISLVQGRIQDRRDMFDNVIEPIFNDLLAIHGDYIKMFEHAKSLLPGESEAGMPDEEKDEYFSRMEDAKEEIRKRRLEFEPVRSKIRALAEALGDTKLPEEEKEFVRSVSRYFPTADPRSPSSAARNILEYLEQVHSPFEIEVVFDYTISFQKQSWSDVCEAFAALKIKVG